MSSNIKQEIFAMSYHSVQEKLKKYMQNKFATNYIAHKLEDNFLNILVFVCLVFCLFSCNLLQFLFKTKTYVTGGAEI